MGEQQPAEHRFSSELHSEFLTDCRIMLGLARACEEFATHLEGNPEVAELLFAVSAHWSRMYERALEAAGEQP